MRSFFLGITIVVLTSIFIICNSLADMKFSEVGAQAGIDNAAKGTCVAFLDYNGDGHIDIYVGNNGRFPEPLGQPNHLYRNNGDGTFTDVAAAAGVADVRQTQGVAFGDFNNDGDPDLYVVNDFGINGMYFNKGDGSFEDVTDAAGVVGGIDVIGEEEVPNGYGVALADENSDGHLDIYIVNLGSPNILYSNNGDGTFAEITEQSGVVAGTGPVGAGTAAAFGDCNNDGRVDLYAINGYGLPSFFYINTGNSFDDRTSKAGIGEHGDAQGCAFGDYDNDGNMDLYVTNFADAQGAPLQNALFRNDGKGIFENDTKEAGLVVKNYSLGTVFGDLDNDGYLDLYVVNNGEPNILYRNNGDGTFTDVTADAGVGDPGLGSSVALGDINNDGYLDIYVANGGFFDEEMGDPDVLYLNNGGTNHWLQIELRGTTSNQMGIGARITVSTGDLHQIREISGGRGYGQNSSIANFGLGEHILAESIEVRWPSGIVQAMGNINADQHIIIEEGVSAPVEPHDTSIAAWGKAKQTEPGIQIADVDFGLGQNYPNPFNPETWIPYQLEGATPVSIRIYNATGQLIRVLDMGYKNAGVYLSRSRAVYWDGKSEAGEQVSSGIYFYTIQAGDYTATRKMLMLK